MLKLKIVMAIIIFIIAFVPKQTVAQTIGLDLIIRNDVDANPDLRYYLYDENGTLLEDRNVSKNTTVFASRHDAVKYTVIVKNPTGDTVAQWVLLPGIIDTGSGGDPPPPNPSGSLYVRNTNPSSDSSGMTVERFFSTPALRIPVVDWIMSTDVEPVKGFGGVQRGWLKYGDQSEWITYHGWGMSDQMDMGKFWFYVKYNDQWRGMVIEKDFIWMNSYLVMKKQPEPPEPQDGMFFRGMDGSLYLYNFEHDSIPHKILTDRLLESLYAPDGMSIIRNE